MRRPANPLAHTSLRARLTALTVVLVAAGLVAAGIATHYALEGFLIDRVDQEFVNPQEPLQNSLPPNSLGEIFGPDGQLLRSPSPPGVLGQRPKREDGQVAPGYHEHVVPGPP